MGTEIFQFQLFGAEKMGFKVGNPMSKSMTSLKHHDVFLGHPVFLSGNAWHRGQGSQEDFGVKMKIPIILIFFYGVIKYDGMYVTCNMYIKYV